MAWLLAAAMFLATYPDSGSYLVMQFHLVMGCQLRLALARAMPAQLRFGMHLQGQLLLLSQLDSERQRPHLQEQSQGRRR